MRKSSIYLTDELKAALAELAGRSGRSEAEVIRHAIERAVDVAGTAEEAPAPPPVHHPRPSLVGVGVGPGDPGLVTARARATLAEADVVVTVSTDVRSVGRAEMVVRAVAPSAPVRRVPFAISGDAAARRTSLEELTDVVIDATDGGRLVALAVIGDPTQWTVFPDLAAAVRERRPGLHVTAEAGVTSYQAAASAAAVPLGRPGSPLVVLDDDHAVAEHLTSARTAVVLYKATTDAAELRAAAGDRDATGLVAELSGLPGQRLVPLCEAGDGPISYLASVLFPATDAPRTRR